MQATYAQDVFDARIDNLKELERLERSLAGKVTRSAAGVYQVGSEVEIKPQLRPVVSQSLAARGLLEGTGSETGSGPGAGPAAGADGLLRGAAPMLKSTGDGYAPPAGFSLGWVLWTLALSNDQTENLIDVTETAADVSGIAAGIAALFGPGTVPLAVTGGIAAALFFVGSAHLKIVNRNGGAHGVYWEGTNDEIVIPAAIIVHSQIFFARYKP